MRRNDREITDADEIRAIMQECKVLRLAMNGDDGTPYIVPMNFGFGWKSNRPVLYLHCAEEGHKLDLLRRNPRVAFEMDCRHALVEGTTACGCTYEYASVMGTGDCEIVTTDAEKEFGLQYLMEHMTGKTCAGFEENVFNRTTVLRVRTDSLTGKKHLR